MGVPVNKIACPSCREQGRDHSGDNLVVYDDGTGHCFVCPKYFTKAEMTGAPKKMTYKSKTTRETVEDINTYPVGGDPTRLLSDDTLIKYDVRCAFDEGTGKVNSVYYPYKSTDGDIIGYKCRKLPKTFAASYPAPSGLFGKQTCKGKGNALLVTEGEEDALAAAEMLKGLPVDCVSLPNGAALDKGTMEEADFFSTYKRIYLCFDNDKPGQKAAAEVADWMCKLAEVRIMRMLEKDASAYIKNGEQRHFPGILKAAEIYEPEGIVNGTDIELADLMVAEEEGLPLPFRGLNDKLHGIRKGEITTVCAGSGIGKSTLVREITKSLIEQGQSIANVALEDQMEIAAKALIALDMNIPLTTLRFRPPPEEVIRPHYEKMVANGKTFFYKHFAGINSATLMNKLYYYARSKQCDFIILDHLSLVISSSPSRDERKDIDTLMTELAKMVVETGVGLIQIVHLKRTGSNATSYSHGGEVELSDLRGSAALEQLSWNVVGLERNQQSDDPNLSTIRVLKNRTWGFLGKAGQVEFNPTTGRLKDLVVSEPPELDTDELYEVRA